MPCDICSSPSPTSTLSATAMRRAVQRGFNPFQEGLIPPPLARLAAPDFPDKWKAQAISGELSTTPWRLCATCRPCLTPFLGAQGILAALQRG